MATKSSEHFRYTLRCILFEFRGANPNIAARALTWATRFFFHLGTTPPWPSPFYRAHHSTIAIAILQGAFRAFAAMATKPSERFRYTPRYMPPNFDTAGHYSQGPVTRNDPRKGLAVSGILPPHSFYISKDSSEHYSEHSLCNTRITPTYILRHQFDRFLICTRWISNKISKKPFFDKKWNFLMWSHNKNRNYRITWSFSGFLSL